jgi:hypothetical protein
MNKYTHEMQACSTAAARLDMSDVPGVAPDQELAEAAAPDLELAEAAVPDKELAKAPAPDQEHAEAAAPDHELAEAAAGRYGASLRCFRRLRARRAADVEGRLPPTVKERQLTVLLPTRASWPRSRRSPLRRREIWGYFG